MRKTATTKKPLNLNSHTIRSLQDAPLDGVAGASVFTGLYCPTKGHGSCQPGTSCACQW